MSQALEIHTIPVISTAHITEEVSRRLSDGSSRWCACAEYVDCGFFLYLDEPHGTEFDPVPQCLLDIRDWRKRLQLEGRLDNSCWVRLECDADPVEDLPVYDW